MRCSPKSIRNRSVIGLAWLEITIPTGGQDVQELAQALTCAGFSDLVIEDQEEFEQFLEENRACWDYIDEDFQKRLTGLSQIKLYLQDSDRESLSRLEAFAEERKLSLGKTLLAQTDWDEDWKKNYPPQYVGERLVVLPYWLADRAEEAELPVILDPGLTFGTGAHPSTQMVMETMENLVKPGFRCLDLGSGSGILSITALRLGAERAVGVDIDRKAEDAARENAAYNGFGEPEFTAMTGNVLEDRNLMDSLTAEAWDLVFVNIVADVIIALAPSLSRLLGSGNAAVCSGILDTRLRDVKAALEKAGLRIVAEKAKEDWRCVTVRRRTL